MRVSVVGAGLAGCEAAWQLARRGIEVRLCEMKPQKLTSAHSSPNFAELVCSNSLKSDKLENASGLLKEEMRRLGGLIVPCADECRVEAGGALAVDRERFSALVTEKIRSHPLIMVEAGEVADIPEGDVIIATGPLTSDLLSASIARFIGEDRLYFYDAAAPIVTVESIDMDKAYFASRYGHGSPDYINCPMDKDEYTRFYDALISAEEAEVHGFEDRFVYEGCMPVEVMARRGRDTLRYGPLKPKGLRDPRTGKTPYAVLQLRLDNSEGTLYNLVGFQTHLKFGEQKRVFGMIPALENAEFERYGVMHRNTFINSPKLLDRYYRLASDPRVSFAGQITGVEGYMESAASGFYAGVCTAARLRGMDLPELPRETAIGALSLYISGGAEADFQPMRASYGIMSPPEKREKTKKDKNLALSARSLAIIDGIRDEFIK